MVALIVIIFVIVLIFAFGKTIYINVICGALLKDPTTKETLGKHWAAIYIIEFDSFYRKLDYNIIANTEDFMAHVDKVLEELSKTEVVGKIYRDPRYWTFIMAQFFPHIRRPWSIEDHLAYVQSRKAEYDKLKVGAGDIGFKYMSIPSKNITALKEGKLTKPEYGKDAPDWPGGRFNY